MRALVAFGAPAAGKLSACNYLLYFIRFILTTGVKPVLL